MDIFTDEFDEIVDENDEAFAYDIIMGDSALDDIERMAARDTSTLAYDWEE